MGRIHPPLFILLGSVALRPVVASAAQDPRWALCPPPPAAPAFATENAAGSDQDNTDNATRVSADRAERVGEQATRFSGNVLIRRNDQRLRADQAEYDPDSDRAQLQGNVWLYTPQLQVRGTQAEADLGEKSGRVEQAQVRVPQAHARASAARVEVQDPQHARLLDATYTTCPDGHDDWRLKADSITLDTTDNSGEARDVSVAFKGVPFLYLPYMSFPLSGRKSGFLPPSIGTGDQGGLDVSIPYYWNLAPNRDATTTLRHIADRGAMVQGEYRYLTRNSEGQLNLDLLPDDRRHSGDNRMQAALRHVSRFSDRWRGVVDYHYVSDSDYFNDLGTGQASVSQTHLERRAELGYQGDNWSFTGRVQDYQTLSGSDPYRRVPQLLVGAGGPALGPLRYKLRGEWVAFDHADPTRVTGNRLDLYPSLSLPLEGAAWHFTPKVGWRYTRYDLTDPAGDRREQRSLGVASLDAGAVFERPLAAQRTQTLEPRLYYLYVPYRDQSALPVFDSGEMDFSFAQLFRDNRFSGSDRIGDANQLALTVSSRMLDKNGGELIRAGIGQLLYFHDRQVILPGATATNTNRSDLVAELGGRPRQDLDLSAAARWDPNAHQSDLVSARLRYRPDAQRILSVGYRLRRNPSLRQADIGVYWPLTPHWRAVGRWHYDLDQERTLESVTGVEYESCCWRVRLVGRGRLDTTTQSTDHSIFLTLELKGLASIGRSLGGELERGILGYY